MGCSALLEHRLLGKQGGSARALLLADTKGFGRCTSTGPGTGNCWARPVLPGSGRGQQAAASSLGACCIMAYNDLLWGAGSSSKEPARPICCLQALSGCQCLIRNTAAALQAVCGVRAPHQCCPAGCVKTLGSSSPLLPCRLCQGVRASKRSAPATAALHQSCQGFRASHCCCHAGGAVSGSFIMFPQHQACMQPSRMGQASGMACNALKHKNLLFAPVTVCAALQVHCDRASR